MSRWTEDVTYRFVAKYMQCEALWNLKSPKYKNKHAKQTAYALLEQHMNIPGFGEKDIKAKIKSIRSTYSQELKKIKDSERPGAGPDDVYVPTVKWFPLIDAPLRNVNFEMRLTHSNLEDTEDIDPHLTRREEEEDDLSLNQSETTNLADTTAQTKIPPTTFKARRARLTQLKSIVDDLKGLSDVVNTPQTENEFAVFGRNVGLQLSDMPLAVALEAQQYIQTYLNRTRLAVMSNQNNFLQPPQNAASINSDGDIRLPQMPDTGTKTSTIPLEDPLSLPDEVSSVDEPPMKKPCLDVLQSESELFAIKTETHESIESTSSSNQGTDPDQIFGDYVASELRQIRNPANKRRLKRLINEALIQIGELEDQGESIVDHSMLDIKPDVDRTFQDTRQS